jgi:hypothetical protein
VISFIKGVSKLEYDQYPEKHLYVVTQKRPDPAIARTEGSSPVERTFPRPRMSVNLSKLTLVPEGRNEGSQPRKLISVSQLFISERSGRP